MAEMSDEGFPGIMEIPSVNETPVILLAGGQGTRLRGLDPSRPKPMVPVCGKPFLHWCLRNLRGNGFQDFILSAGYLSEQIEGYPWESEFPGCRVRVHRETLPLGTGGATLAVFKHYVDLTEAWVVNGDTYLPEPMPEILPSFLTENETDGPEEAVFCVLQGSGVFDDEPNLVVEGNRVISRIAGGKQGFPCFDAGAVFVTRTALDRYFGKPVPGQPLSLHQVLSTAMEMRRVGYRILSGTCYDIGTPQRFRRFEAYLEQSLHEPRD